MIVRDLMTSNISTVTPDTSVEEVATLMRDEDTGAIPVVENNELIGIVTDRDIVLRCVAQGMAPSETVAEEVMSSDVETVSPGTDVERASDLMSEKQIRRLPVTEDGKLVGMLSLGDIAVKEREPPTDDAGEALRDISRGVKRSEAGKDHSRKRGISNHGRGQEQDRQSQVIPFREQGKRTPRRKTGS